MSKEKIKSLNIKIGDILVRRDRHSLRYKASAAELGRYIVLERITTNYDIDERGAYFVCMPIYIRPEWGRATGQNLQNFTYITVNEIDDPGDHYVFLRVSKAEA